MSTEFMGKNYVQKKVTMNTIRVAAISTELAEAVRKNAKDPQFGFPVYTAEAGEGLPCRHCLDWIAERKERATLFTLDPFAGVENLPLPGPVYIHADGCARYSDDAGIPRKLMTSPRTLNAYARGRRLVAQEYVDFASAEATIERLFARLDVHYVHVRSTTAGCYTFRLERAVIGIERPATQDAARPRRR
jgi:Protein of unknown function (DUF1203)